MVDFRKKLSSGGDYSKKTNPIEIYETLDRASDKGPLRPAQHSILSDWYSNRNDDRDIIIKLHTGQGKTLIGLLILQSKLNAGKGPAVFICPNKLLVDQTCEQAKQFGIKYCKIEDDLPHEFIEGKSILITHVQKMFNGLSVFGIGKKYEEVGAIVLDDSHACIDAIQSAVTIKIERKDNAYAELLQLFDDDLEKQGATKLEEIKSKHPEAILPVPYWAWREKNNEVIKILVKYRDLLSIKFSWNILQDEIEACTCVISAAHIEIAPNRIPIEKFASFHNARHRILMSATTNNDSFFIKGLAVNKHVVKNPLLYQHEKWSGEKMILIPRLIQEELNRTLIVNSFAPPGKRKIGIVALVPSFNTAKFWEERGAIIARDNIAECVKQLRDGNRNETIVFANRYDGIDLPDDACRILIIDQKPFAQSIIEQYQENCRTSSELIDIKIAQKIEQGFGRGVRGEKDYCVIIISSADLITNFRSRKLKKYFSAQTNKQVEIGLEIAKMAATEATTDKGWDILVELINQCLHRDDGWKEYYVENMDKIEEKKDDASILDILELEKLAEEHFAAFQYDKAAETIQLIIDKYIPAYNSAERGWYLQETARMLHPSSQVESNKMQIAAHKHNRSLMRPTTGMAFKKLELNKTRIEAIRDFLAKFDDYNELSIEIIRITSSCAFGMRAESFENGIFALGQALGFESERPDHDWKAGPDNLWNIKQGQYILFECKSEALETRQEIYKEETGQMNNSCAWFKKNYGSENVKNVIIIPTKNISKGAGFNEKVEVLRKGGLNKLKKNVLLFFEEFKKFDIKNVTDEQIHHALQTHGLTEDNILNDYFEQPFQR